MGSSLATKVSKVTVVLLLMLFSSATFAEGHSRLTLDNMWLGSSVKELRAHGLVDRTEKSLLLWDGLATFTEESSAHFQDERAVLISGLILRFGSEIVLKEGDTWKQSLAKVKELGWIVDGTWDSPTDIAQHHNRVLRVRVSDAAFILLVFFRSDFTPDKPEVISEIYLRTETCFAPFGDVCHD